MRDYETRDHYETFPTRRSAAEYAQNTALPQWLRDAWAAVSRGEYRSVEQAAEALGRRKAARKRGRSQADPNAARQRALTSKMLDPIDVYQQMKMRELMKKEHDPYYWD